MNRFSESLLPYTKMLDAGAEGDCSAAWVAGRSILAYGVRIGIRTNKPEFLDRILDYAPPLWKPTSVPFVERLFSFQLQDAGLRKKSRLPHILMDDLETVARSGNLKEIFEAFETRLKMYVAEMARRRVFVHAGAVGWKGKAIIIPGRSMSGKTSLVAELVRAGATYYSDEYAVLDMYGRVHPYPQPLAIRKEGTGKQAKWRVEKLGGVAGTRPLPVGLVVVSRYKAGSRWRPGQLTAGQGILALLDNTIPARRKPEVVLPTLQSAVSEATILKGARGEAEETARLILKRCF
jgi:hypothetical protein